MHSIFVVVVAALLAALSRSTSAASSGSEANEKHNKELEQKYNKIFSGSLFTQDPETTNQWLKELHQQLEYDESEKHEKVRKLLAFDKSDRDCDLTKGSGDELAGYHRLFTAPDSTTPTIKAYITSCLARMYEKCRESFLASTEKAVDQLGKSPDYERMLRLRELVASGSDLKSPVVQFLLEQVHKHPKDEEEFGVQFKGYIMNPCKTVRDKLHFMVHFDALLTMKQIKSMGESVRQWQRVHAVCRWVLLDEDAVKKELYRHVTYAIDKKDLAIGWKYWRIFTATLWALKPEETYKELVWLATKMDKDTGYWNSEERRREVWWMIEAGQFWQTKQCNLDAAKNLNGYLFKYLLAKRSYTIKRYLLHLRDQAFELCRKEMAEQVAGSVQRLAQDSHRWKKIFRLQEFLKKFGRRELLSRLYDILLGFMDEQAGAPLSPEMGRAQFEKQLEAMVLEPCKMILGEFSYFIGVRNIWRVGLANRMDPTVKDWLLTSTACSEYHDYRLENYKQDQEPVYARLLARGRIRLA